MNPSGKIGGMIEAATEESFIILPGRVDAGLLLVCDHAANAFPSGYGTLGLPVDQLQRHIAYDIGAAAVTRAIAVALEAPAVLTRFSIPIAAPTIRR